MRFLEDFMKRSIELWQLMGFALSTLFGTLLHFLYDFTGKSCLAALFSGVNESTWEHMKLLLWPMLLYAIFESFFFRERGDFWCVKLRGILLGLLLIPVIFYTYNGAIGKSPDWLNVTIFFVSAAIAFAYEARRFNVEEKPCKRPWLAITLLAFLAVLFIVFTFKTPEIGIFKDPLTGMSGI